MSLRRGLLTVDEGRRCGSARKSRWACFRVPASTRSDLQAQNLRQPGSNTARMRGFRCPGTMAVAVVLGIRELRVEHHFGNAEE